MIDSTPESVDTLPPDSHPGWDKLLDAIAGTPRTGERWENVVDRYDDRDYNDQEQWR